MTLEFTSLKVYPHFETDAPGGFDAYWSISGHTFTPTFQVYVAETEVGPWTALLVTKTPAFQLLNASTPKANIQAGVLTWFKVEVFNGNTSKLISPPMDSRGGMDRRRYLQYREILRRWRLHFNKTNCLDGWLVRRKFFGTRCPECANELVSSPSSGECTTCFGTGISGGYFPAVLTKADWSAGVSPRTSNAISKESPGPQAPQKLKIKIPCTPDAKSEDVWLDKGTGIYYLVEAVEPEMWCGSVITQTAQISRLPAHHPVYKLPRPS